MCVSRLNYNFRVTNWVLSILVDEGIEGSEIIVINLLSLGGCQPGDKA